MSGYRVMRWQETHAPNAAMLRFRMEHEGYRVFQWGDRPEATYALHKHDQDQSHWIISGELELTIEKVGTIVLQAGDRDFMPAHTWHSARVLGEEAVVYLVGEKLK